MPTTVVVVDVAALIFFVSAPLYCAISAIAAAAAASLCSSYLVQSCLRIRLLFRRNLSASKAAAAASASEEAATLEGGMAGSKTAFAVL